MRFVYNPIEIRICCLGIVERRMVINLIRMMVQLDATIGTDHLLSISHLHSFSRYQTQTLARAFAMFVRKCFFQLSGSAGTFSERSIVATSILSHA